MDVVHNYEQIMAWRRADLRGLIGSRITVHQPADDRAFQSDPHGYVGEWKTLASGTVANIGYTVDSGGYSGRFVFGDGNWFGWISGQPISITEMKE